jgi:hypothetical protein
MALPQRVRRRKEPVFLRVVKGALVPADGHSETALRARKYSMGDVLSADLSKPRHPKHHKLVMSLLKIVLDNQDGLQTIDQLLTIVKIKMGRAAPFVDSATNKTYWVVESISFASMDQGEFEVFWEDLKNLVARDYLPGMTPDQLSEAIDRMENHNGGGW